MVVVVLGERVMGCEVVRVVGRVVGSIVGWVVGNL